MITPNQNEKGFEALINAIPQLAWMARPDGFIYWFNNRFYEYTGKTLEDLLQNPIEILKNQEILDDITSAWERSHTTGTPFEYICQVRCHDGVFRWFITRALPVRDDNDNITRWVGTCTDIDEQTKIQRELTDTLEAMTDGFIAIDKDWKINQINSAVLRKTGLKRDELVGRDFREVFFSTPELQFNKALVEYEKLKREQTPVAFEAYYAPLDIWTSTRAYPTSEGGFTIFSVDITEKKRAERQMREAKEVAERANELKSSFLANMSHEIRTPLGAMLGFADLLRDPDLSAGERASYLDILTKNGEQLSVIINDILDLSKVEAGHLTLEFLPSSPEAIAKDVVALMTKKARDKALNLDFVKDPSTPEHVVSDPGRVRQVLLNLVTNAVKFTLAGSVQITSSGRVDSKGRQFVDFKVTDTGIGISPEQQERIFGSFVQADGSMTRRFGGTGLGLALSRLLARALGGDVTLESSVLSRGSTFSFTYPDSPERQATTPSTDLTAAALEAAKRKTSLCGIKVLVVDDSTDNQMLISKFLTAAGAEVSTAVNGLEGSDKALAGDFNLVLMDIQMPVMDGYSAAQRLRERGYAKPIIALTAHALNEARKKALSVGCTDHLTKPINRTALIETVARYANEPALV